MMFSYKQRYFSIIVLVIVFSSASLSQSLNDLEINPSFKGITIGEPISKYSEILKYNTVYKGKTSYIVTNSNYYTIFKIKMDDMVVIEKEGKVWGVFMSKKNPAGSFNPKELEVLKSSLCDRYGYPNVDLTDTSGDPTIFGVRWQTSRILLDIAYLFYGTFEGSKLQYILYQREDDY